MIIFLRKHKFSDLADSFKSNQSFFGRSICKCKCQAFGTRVFCCKLQKSAQTNASILNAKNNKNLCILAK